MKTLLLILLATIILLAFAYAIFNFFRPISSEEIKTIQTCTTDKNGKLDLSTCHPPAPDKLPPRDNCELENKNCKG